MPRARVALASIACAIVLGVTACSPTDADGPEGSAAPPSAAATDEPIFASDEEALAAAVEAYEAYAEASTRIANAGGEGSDAIAPFVDERYNKVVQDEFAALREAGLKTVGEAIHYNADLANYSEDEGLVDIAVEFCRDVSGTRVIRADGADVTPTDREPIQAVRVMFVSSSTNDMTLVVGGAERLHDEAGC